MKPLTREAIKVQLHKARLLLKCEIDEKTGCWIWLGSTDKRGYGHIKVDGARIPVTRLAYALWKGKALPPDRKAMRTCKNPRCFNPVHARVKRMKLRRTENVQGQ
jgi:hypothetical protein